MSLVRKVIRAHFDGLISIYMQIAPLSENEAARLAELQRYEILGTPPEEAFDGLT
jgi:hypothetical protein